MFEIHNTALSKNDEQLKFVHLLKTLRNKQQIKLKNKMFVKHLIEKAEELKKVENLKKEEELKEDTKNQAKNIKMLPLKVTKQQNNISENMCSENISLMLEKYKILQAKINHNNEMLSKVNTYFSGISLKQPQQQEPSQRMKDIINLHNSL